MLISQSHVRWWFNNGLCRNALSQPSMCPVQIVYTTCATCTKCDFFKILKQLFTIKRWGDSKFILTDGYDCEALSHHVISEFAPQYFSFKTPIFSPTIFSGCWSLLYTTPWYEFSTRININCWPLYQGSATSGTSLLI